MTLAGRQCCVRSDSVHPTAWPLRKGGQFCSLHIPERVAAREEKKREKAASRKRERAAGWRERRQAATVAAYVEEAEGDAEVAASYYRAAADEDRAEDRATCGVRRRRKGVVLLSSSDDSGDEGHVLRDCNVCGDVCLAAPELEWDAVRCGFCRRGGKMRVARQEEGGDSGSAAAECIGVEE